MAKNPYAPMAQNFSKIPASGAGKKSTESSGSSVKVLAEKPLRGVRLGKIQHSVTYELTENGFEKVARKGNAEYAPCDRFSSQNPDHQTGVTQNVGKPARGDALRGAIEHLRGKR